MSSRLRTLVTPGALPSPAPALPTRRHASFGASAFRRLLPTSLTSTRSSTPSTPAAAKVESGQGLYDLAVLDEEVVERGEAKKSSFVRFRPLSLRREEAADARDWDSTKRVRPTSRRVEES